MARGASNREIADELYLAETMIKTHVRALFNKARRPGPGRGHHLRLRRGFGPATTMTQRSFAAL
ncbi:LuxR C-terminal-related transcriptional regulator [Promicromonospora sp. CA-289599]|uniref:LuxR C-terminal-related transcriptional regulator n=1 Tax=Promicromonospora sp. CA-289599 TaxID=3240014 RepID=UPI003D90A6BF